MRRIMHSFSNGLHDNYWIRHCCARARLVGGVVCYGLVLLVIFWQFGCASFRRGAATPKATIALSSGGTIKQTGDAQVPAKVSVVTSNRSLSLPEGSEFLFNEKLGTFTLRLSHESTLKSETREEKAEAPQAFIPPAPPTPQDEAEGRIRVWFWVGLVVGIGAGLFGLVRGWDMVMYGGGCVAGGCALGLFVQQNPFVFVLIAVGVALKIAGPVLWHTVAKKLPPSPTP